MDFRDIPSNREEQIRAWSIERAIQIHGSYQPVAEIIAAAVMVEAYVTSGDATSAITAAVEEGYNEGRFQVKEAVEEKFEKIDLTPLFKANGWVDPEHDTITKEDKG